MEVVSTAVSIISLLCSCSNGTDLCNPCKLQRHKEALEIAMEELKDARDDVQRRIESAEADPNEPVKRTSQVDGWLQRVQTVDGEVGDILQKAELHIKGRSFGCGHPKNCWSSHKHGKLMIRKLELLKDLNSKANFENLTHRLPPPSVQEIPLGSTVGMESMFEKAWRFLGEDDIRILGLYGQGGVGKTTLLKKINNAFLESTNNTFDVVIFVVVSKALNIEAIQKEIGKRLSLPSPNKTSIFNVLKMKKFVLLLDDLWERLDLQGDVGIPPPNNSSKVIFTTRSEAVCGLMEANKKMKVDCLPWDQAWNLFQEKVGEEALMSHPKVHELAKVVAKECSGLPLVLITIGRAMSTKKTPEQWNYAIKILRQSPYKFPGMGDKILPLLMLSYDNLHNDTIKYCFLYFSLFPEDFSIDVAQLIDLWVGEGFLRECDNIDEAIHQGHEVIGTLKDACLIECVTLGDEHYAKMHDVVRDLALWITTDFGRETDKFLVVDQVGNEEISNTFRRWKNAERIYLRINEFQGLEESPKSPNLLTLLLQSTHRHHLLQPNFLFQFTPLLRVVDLSGWKGIEGFPSSITELAELQFLNLSRTHIIELPDALRKLVKLKWLGLTHTPKLKKIPGGVIGSLVELRVLKMILSFGDWDDEIESDQDDRRFMAASIIEVGGLKHLNHLDMTICNILAFEKFSSSTPQMFQICTKIRLCVQILKDVKSLTLSSSLHRIKSLTTLVIYKCVDLEEFRFMNGPLLVEEDGQTEELILSCLSKFERVVVEKQSQDKMIMAQQQQHTHGQYSLCSSSFLHNLTQITIDGCHAIKELTWLVYVKKLEYLRLYHCKGIEEIIAAADDFGGRKGSLLNRDGNDGVDNNKWTKKSYVFKRLKVLNLQRLPELKSICRHELNFPSVETVRVAVCPKLRKLPFGIGSNPNSSLQEIQGHSEWWDKLQWEDENVKSKFSPHFKHW